MHTYVAGLRRVLEPGRSRRGPSQVLASAGAGYVLRLDAGQVDAVVFERSLQHGRGLRISGDLNGAIAALEVALGEWHGSAFAGVPGPFAGAERVRLAELRSAAAEERAEVLLDLGRHEQAVPELAALVAEHPLRERMRGLLMIALYRCGRQAEALQAFHEARQVLDDELGIDPGPELSRVHLQILALDPDLEAPGGDRAPAPAAASPGPVPDPAPAQLPLEAPGDGKRVLIVLDNARDSDQVRPLLPGSPGSLVVVTSRSQLTGLVAAEGATPLSLDVLTEDEAHELLGRPARPGGRRGRAGARGRADRLVRAAAAGPRRGGGPRGDPARAIAGRAGRRAAGHPEPAGGAGGRGRGHRRTGRAVLVV